MVAVPFFFPVTNPFPVTVATFFFEDVKVSLLLALPLDSLVFMVKDFLFFNTFFLEGVVVILAGAFFTVTVKVAVFPERILAVIFAVPAFLAVIFPELFTVATDLLELE